MSRNRLLICAPHLFMDIQHKSRSLTSIVNIWSFVRKTILYDKPETAVFLVGKTADFNEIHRFQRISQCEST